MKGIIGPIAAAFCVFAAACGSTSPAGPTSSMSANGGVTGTQAQGGSELPFKGTYEGEEKEPDPTVPSKHHLEATGTATHLGRFTATADWTVTGAGGGPIETSSTWTAANGDKFYTSFTRSRATLTFTEIHTILGGTGRFANASGTFTVVQIRALSTLPSDNSATIDGTIDLGH